MKALVWHTVRDVRIDDVPDPKIEQPTDAVVRLTASAICGTYLHMARGTFPGMVPGTILGHEGVGIVEEVVADVRNFEKGDRVVICSTICCGTCEPCRRGSTAQCDGANTNGPHAGTSFFGGPKTTGPGVSDEQGILISDVFPTGWFGAELAEVGRGDAVVVFGCGAVGLFTIASAVLMGAGRVIAVDKFPDRHRGFLEDEMRTPLLAR